MSTILTQSLDFRQSAVSGLNLSDPEYAPAVSINSFWTLGATIIDLFTIQANPDHGWTITGWSLNYSMTIAQGDSTRVSYGKLGKLVAGILFRPPVPQTPGAAFPPPLGPALTHPWNFYPGYPVPPNTGNLATVFDPASDPLPPWTPVSSDPVPPASGATLIPLTFSSQLPVPIELSSGDSISGGMWLTPSLVANLLIRVYNAVMTVYYTLN